MSLHDLVETDCGGANSLVKFATHFVQDHAFKDQNLKQTTHDKNSEQQFLEASTGELADQFFSSEATESFKMDAILEELRYAEGTSSREESWPTKFTNKTKKQDHLFDPNIWSTSDNKMLIKDEVYDLGYNPEWVKEIEQTYQNKENTATKSRFDFNKSKDVGFEPATSDSIICNNLMEPQLMSFQNMTTPLDMGVGLFEHPLFTYQDLEYPDIESNLCQEFYNIEVPSMIPNISGTDNSVSVIRQPSTSAEQVKVSESENKVENENDDINSQDWVSEYEEMKNVQRKKEYCFTPNNEMESIENPLVEGKRRLENGELPIAVLCFEAAVKQDSSNAEAWQLLGTTQAENEQDQLAINALNKCIELQPDNLTALLCLAACYTNESYNLEACQMLMEWLNKNTKYSDIVKAKPLPEEPRLMKYLFTTKLYDIVKDMYIEAAQRSLETGSIDADVQNGLGVLLNLNNENDKAVDCFKAALQVRPEDARLWNRLGATLANGGRCEEAIEAYHNALQLCPGFVRARYNLGITCIHLDTYREAIEHLLVALNQQASAVSTNFKSPVLSDTIWSTLRLAISMSERSDLLKAVNDRNLDLLNEEFNYNGLY